MSEQVQFHKGTEIYLPGANIDNAGHLFHCEDTKNTYLSNNGTMELFSSAVGARQLNGDDEVGGMLFGDIDNNIAYYTYDEAHGIGTQTAQRARPDNPVVVLGKYNDDAYEPFVIGNGTSDDNRSDLFVVSENWGVRYKDVQMNPLMLYGSLDIDNTYEPIVRVSRTNYDDGLSWNLFEKHFFTSFHAAYLELSLESWGQPNPARLPLVEEHNAGCSLNTEMFHRFSGPIKIYEADAICTVTWQWDDGYIWDVELTFLSPMEIECAYRAGDAPLQPIDYPTLISSALYKFWHRGNSGDGHYNYTYRHRAQIEVDEETWYFYGRARVDNCPDRSTIYRASRDEHDRWIFRAIDDVSYPTPKMKHATTNNYNLRECPSFNAPVLLGNLRSKEFSPTETYRYMSSVHNKDNPILADLASGTISAPGGLLIEQTEDDISITTRLGADNLNMRYNERDLTYGAQMESGYLSLTSTDEDNQTCKNNLSYDAIQIEKVTEDDDKVLDIDTRGISFENRSSRCHLTAHEDGSVLSLGYNSGADYSIKSYIVSGNPTLAIRCDSTDEDIITSYNSNTQICTPNFLVDGLQVDSSAHFLDEVEIDGGVYIDGSLENASGIYTYNTIYAEGAITSDSTITGYKVYGAVWNDYAEFRTQTTAIEPGYCVTSSNNGLVSKTTEKLQACDGIVSDTYGFAIGETDECQTPLAVAGRVLAYCEGDRNSYNAGDTVGAGPDGKVCKMTREEIREWPDRIVGIVSEIPNYETWGSGNIPVNGRIWIKIK